jgi:hypothetical protein
LRRALYLSMFLSLLGQLQGCNPFGGDNRREEPPTDRGYFRISSPKPGARLHLDSNHAILWSTAEAAADGPVRITLHRGDEEVAILSSAAVNGGTLIWRPTKFFEYTAYRFGSGTGYRIRIAGVPDTSEWEYSGTFSLYSDFEGSLRVTTPATGAEVRIDSGYGIRWRMTGDAGPALGIQIYKDAIMVHPITVSAMPKGYYLWSEPGIALGRIGAGDDYRLRIFSRSDPSIEHVSEPFSLMSPYTGSIKVTSPGAGDTLAAGISRTLAWTASGNPGSEVRVVLMLDSTWVSSLNVSGLPTDTLAWTPGGDLNTSSRYRIQVTSRSDAGIVGYSGYFTVKGYDPDAYETDDTRETAKAIPVSGEAQQRTLTNGDEDWAAFETVAGKYYLVSAHASVGSLNLNLFDSLGGVLHAGSAGRPAQTVLSPTRSGSCFARVTSGSGYGPYTLSVDESDSLFAPMALPFTAPVADSFEPEKPFRAAPPKSSLRPPPP